VFGAIRKGINYAWGIKKTRRFLQERLMDVTLVLGAGMLVLLVLFTGIVFGVFREVTDALVPEWTFASGFLWGAVAKVVSAALAFLTFLLLYRYLPNTTVRFNDVWPERLWRLSPSAAPTGSSSGTCRPSRSTTSSTGRSGPCWLC
jgi:uncharacterized BrkB/YihY/UPF0761 family membrane protein